MSASSGGTRHLVAFEISPELMGRARAAVAAVREQPSDRRSRKELVRVVLALTERGMDFYYLQPLHRAGAGAVLTSAARVGIAAAAGGMPAIVRRVVSSLDEQQLLGIADFIDEILISTSSGA